MKKIISLILATVMLLSVLSLVGCGETNEALKFGLGITAYVENIKSAEGDVNGQGELASTAAAVLLDKDGKIVKCTIDALDSAIAFDAKGQYINANAFTTKKEAGKDYGMVAEKVSKKEWYEQVDAFEKLVVGKTLKDVKALIAKDNKGNDEVINAGCTIIISDFVSAIEKAVNSAKDSKATKDETINLGFAASQTGKNATAEAAGNNEIEVSVSAIAKDKDGKAVASITDAFTANLNFDIKGITTTTGNIDIKTKLELGNDYGMVAYKVSKKEWFEHAAEFDKAVIGKKADEIAKLVVKDGKGTEEIVNAGCTIAITDLVKAAEKAAK